MKINSPSNLAQAINAYQGRTPSKTGKNPAAQGPSSSTSVHLSAGSQAIHNSANDIDMAKVQAIRDALADGSLKINPEKIAQGLISSASELLE